MNKGNIQILVLIIVSLFSCIKEDTNRSKLTTESGGNFIITSIQAGPDGEVMCIGLVKDTDSTVVKRYDRNLKLIQILYPSRMPGLQGKLKLTCLQDQGWVIGGFIKSTPRLSIFLTDKNFSITARSEQNCHAGSEVNIYTLKRLKNGDFLLAIDSSIAPNSSTGTGLRISRLDPQLNAKFDFIQEPFSASYRYHSPYTFEIQDGSIFYTYLQSVAKGIPATKHSHFLISGILDQDGKKRMWFSTPIVVTHTEAIGLSYTGSNFVFNSIVNDEHLQYYTSIDPLNGKLTKTSSLGFNYINNQIITSYFNGHFPLGEANQLPEQLKPGQGHFIYSEVDKKLNFLSVDENVNLSLKFPLLLPEFTEIFSYRQLFTEEGTIIVGTSYQYNGMNYFNLQEVTVDGKVVK